MFQKQNSREKLFLFLSFLSLQLYKFCVFPSGDFSYFCSKPLFRRFVVGFFQWICIFLFGPCSLIFSLSLSLFFSPSFFSFFISLFRSLLFGVEYGRACSPQQVSPWDFCCCFGGWQIRFVCCVFTPPFPFPFSLLSFLLFSCFV